MVTFDEVLPTLVRVCEATPGFTSLRRCCVVRDLQGRVRLVVDPDASAAPVDVMALAAALQQELGSYFAGPIWSTGAKGRDEARLAAELLKRPDASPWEIIYDDPATGRSGVRSQAPWRKMERRISKQAWLEAGQANAPWELGEGPGIVTFYSFKGGVGRTTALAACAWQLARAGKKVAVIDLDLEAPGIGSLLDGEAKRGVIDFLTDHLASGSARLDEMAASARALGEEDQQRVQVLGAGLLGPSYLEKLGRLDYLAADAGKGDDPASSPIEQALRELLFCVRRQLKPDYILLDSRAGVHDLAGLSLHRLAHVDVIVGRGNEQGYRGLDLTVSTLARRKGLNGLQCVLVHSFVDSEGLPAALFEEQEFRERSYQIFVQHIYRRANMTVSEEDPGPHASIVLRYDAALARFASLLSIRPFLFTRGYVQLRERFEALCAGTTEMPQP